MASCGDAPVRKAEEPPTPATAPDWPGVAYKEVRAYYASTPFLESFQQAGIPEQVEDKDGVLLNADQEQRLISAATTEKQPEAIAVCWNPRHAFVFYDDAGKAVAEVDVCFECANAMGAYTKWPDLGALATLVTDLGLPLGLPER